MLLSVRKILKHPQFISSLAQRSFSYCSSSTPGFAHWLLPAAVWVAWHQPPTCLWGSSISPPFLPHLLKLWMTHSKILLTRLRSLPTQLTLCKNKHEPFFVFPVALGYISSMERSSPTWVSGTEKGEQNSQMGKELSLTGKLPGRDIYIYILLGCLTLHWDHSDPMLDPEQSSGHAEAPEVVQTQSANTTQLHVIPFVSLSSGCWCTISTKDHISADLKWNPLHQQENAEGQVKAGLWCQGPRDRYPPGSCWHGAGGTAHSRGPFWTGTFFLLRIT